ncbi:Uu.00g058340.m01.CDS01 [Anthostomella pinea]|uniref:Uu.00g058340.m01.CDS01 n=1 Tax=Anthostomella pinea TaxID=933095 RepID=A0AAI8YMA3_9PEZI|nr:Uu.00g058340.m01.CDS01 [Anthostomella pinea]
MTAYTTEDLRFFITGQGRSVSETESPSGFQVRTKAPRATFGWFGQPRIKISEVSSNLAIGDVKTVKPESDEAKKISSGTMFINYKAIAGKHIAPKVIGIIEADDSKDMVGFILKYIPGRAAGPDEKEKCFMLLEKLWAEGWSHGDVQAGNFIVTSRGDVYLIDYEFAKAVTNNGNAKDLYDFEQDFYQG